MALARPRGSPAGPCDRSEPAADGGRCEIADGELEVALRAVRAASRACRAVQQRMVRPETLQKRDKSPVTVADFASQAIVCALLERRLPRDPVVGEESAKALREDAQAALRAAVVERVRERARARAPTTTRVLAWIDRGDAEARGRATGRSIRSTAPRASCAASSTPSRWR